MQLPTNPTGATASAEPVRNYLPYMYIVYVHTHAVRHVNMGPGLCRESYSYLFC